MKGVGIFVIVVVLFGIGERLTCRTMKKPTISVGMGIANKLLKLSCIGCLGFLCYFGKEMKIKWVVAAFVGTMLVSFLIAWIWMKKVRIQLRIKSDEKPNTYVIASSEILVLIAGKENVFSSANVGKVWFEFLTKYGQRYARERDLTQAVLGKYHMIPLQRYESERAKDTNYEKQFLLFYCKRIPSWQWKRVETFLKQKEQEGFQIILCGMKEGNAIYSEWPVYVGTQCEIPFEVMEKNELWKKLKQVYLEMRKVAGDWNAIQKLCLADTLERQCSILMEIIKDSDRIEELPEEVRHIDWRHRGVIREEEKGILTFAETVLRILKEGIAIREKAVTGMSEAEIHTCNEKIKYIDLSMERKKDTQEEVIRKKAEFFRKYRGSAVWSLYGKEEVFRGWSKGLNGKYMTKARFDKDYAEQILKEEVQPRDYHDLLMKLETERVVHLLDGESWDAMHSSWFSSIPIEEAYISNLTMEGEFLPVTPVRIGFLHPGFHDMKNPFPWIRSIEIRKFEEREELIKWIRHDSIETEVESERTRFYRKALKETGCESVFLNSNMYLAGLYKNAFDRKDMLTSALALLDFTEYALLNVKCVLMELEEEAWTELKGPTFAEMGSYLLQHAKEGSVLYERTQKGKITIPEPCRELQQDLKQVLLCEIIGEEMDFRSLIQILHQIQKRIQEIGVGEIEDGEKLWKLMVYYTIMMNRFLDLYNFGIRVDNTKIWAGYIEGYEDGYVRTRRFFLEDEGVPCPIWEIRNGEKKYINYFYGRYCS